MRQVHHYHNRKQPWPGSVHRSKCKRHSERWDMADCGAQYSVLQMLGNDFKRTGDDPKFGALRHINESFVRGIQVLT